MPAQHAVAGSAPAFAATQASRIVERLYLGVLARAVDPAGLSTYAPLVAGGHLYEVASALATSAELDARRPTLTVGTLVDALYLALLDRPADPDGAAATAEAVRAGALAGRAAAMILSSEYAARN